jgi:hypothetical protein
LTLNAGALLDIQLGAPSSADLINVTAGTTTINGGTINLTDEGGLAVGTYPIIDYVGALAGSAASLGFGTVPAGFSFSIQDTGSLINLLVTAGLTGDFNDDGKVDAALCHLAEERDGEQPAAQRQRAAHPGRTVRPVEGQFRQHDHARRRQRLRPGRRARADERGAAADRFGSRGNPSPSALIVKLNPRSRVSPRRGSASFGETRLHAAFSLPAAADAYRILQGIFDTGRRAEKI